MPSAEVSGRKIYYEIHPAAHDGESEFDENATPLVLVMGMGGSCRGLGAQRIRAEWLTQPS